MVLDKLSVRGALYLHLRMLSSVWTRAIVRISMSVGGTEALTDYGKHDLAHTLS